MFYAKLLILAFAIHACVCFPEAHSGFGSRKLSEDPVEGEVEGVLERPVQRVKVPTLVISGVDEPTCRGLFSPCTKEERCCLSAGLGCKVKNMSAPDVGKCDFYPGEIPENIASMPMRCLECHDVMTSAGWYLG